MIYCQVNLIKLKFILHIQILDVSRSSWFGMQVACVILSSTVRDETRMKTIWGSIENTWGFVTNNLKYLDAEIVSNCSLISIVLQSHDTIRCRSDKSEQMDTTYIQCRQEGWSFSRPTEINPRLKTQNLTKVKPSLGRLEFLMSPWTFWEGWRCPLLIQDVYYLPFFFFLSF